MAEVSLPFEVDSDADGYCEIVEESCPECGYDRATHAHITVPGVSVVTCNACGHTIHS